MVQGQIWRWLRTLAWTVFVLVVLAFTGGALLYFWYLHFDELPRPSLSAEIQRGSIVSGGLERSYLYYVPEKVADRPALIFAFHGARGSGEGLRRLTGYELERRADEDGPIVVYPDGFANRWNDCRTASRHEARERNVDDVGFVRALIAEFRSNHGIDASRVFALGFSNGGHLAFRLALEAPEEVAGIAAIAASLPRKDNSDCRESGKPVAAAILNGTADRVNPFDGGEVRTPWRESLGFVQSTQETADYFLRLANLQGPPRFHRYAETDQNSATWVERSTWGGASSPEVAVFVIHGGGHTIPHPVLRMPRILGATCGDINGVEEIWRFFNRQSRLH